MSAIIFIVSMFLIVNFVALCVLRGKYFCLWGFHRDEEGKGFWEYHVPSGRMYGGPRRTCKKCKRYVPTHS